MSKFDWRWLRSFTLIVQFGGVSSAAQHSDLSQPTLSRHLAALEEFYGSPLLRHAGGLTVTALGEEVLSHAQSMAESAGVIESLAQSTQQTPGSVRLSVSPAIAQHLLPRVLAPLPESTTNVEVIIEGEVSDVLRRESDIAIRLFRPTQQELKTRKVGEIHYGVYVHRRLIGSKRKARKEDILTNSINLIGFVEPNSRERNMLQYLEIDPDAFRISCDDRGWRTTAVEFGLGAGIVPEYVASQRPDLLRVEGMDVPVIQEVWMTTSKASFAGRATKDLFNSLSARFRDIFGL